MNYREWNRFRRDRHDGLNLRIQHDLLATVDLRARLDLLTVQRQLAALDPDLEPAPREPVQDRRSSLVETATRQLLRDP
jgi:hypothetical protein